MQRSAFSLVELSIVLVILGLLTGGILAGKSLIHASELRAVTTEFNRYYTARNTFRSKYFQLPGDLSNAYSFWGAACGTNATTAGTGCNGDGDGTIESAGVSEDLKAWEHLQRAGLIEGGYDGTGSDPGGGYLLSTSSNSPLSKLSQGIWLMTDGNVAANVSGGGTQNAYLVIAQYLAGTYPFAGLASLSHADAWNIDMKMDDGKADKGKVRGDAAGDCYDVGGTDYYGIQQAGPDYTGDCVLYFIL